MFAIPNDNNEGASRYLTYEQMNLINAFRGVFLEQASMSRLMQASLIFDTPCADAIFSRLMQSPQITFDTFSNYYGAEMSERAANLISQNLIIMRNLAIALKEKNEEEATSLLQQWNRNIDEVSDLFASMNPYWIKEQWHSLLYRYFQLNYQQMLALITEDCERSLRVFDRIRSVTVLMGDLMARGIMFGLSEIPFDTGTSE